MCVAIRVSLGRAQLTSHAPQNNLYSCAALFATLLNFKHIFIYLALPYFVFLLRRHCYPPGGSTSSTFRAVKPPLITARSAEFQIDRVVELGLIVASICTISFGPFVVAGGFSQLRQIFSRLFPFQRGLNHAYWAGNVWAIVSAVDRVLVKCKSCGSLEGRESASLTRLVRRSRRARMAHLDRSAHLVFPRPHRLNNLRRPPQHHPSPYLRPHLWVHLRLPRQALVRPVVQALPQFGRVGGLDELSVGMACA